MGQERVWQKLGRGEGGFQMSGIFSNIEHDIFSVLEQVSEYRFTVGDIVGTRIVKRFAEDRNLYGGSMQLHRFYRRPTPSPFEKVHFRLRHNFSQGERNQDELLSTSIIICYEKWESLVPSIGGLYVHVRSFVKEGGSLAFQEVPLSADSDPFSEELWLGKKPPFSTREQWLRETKKAEFIFCSD